MLFCFLFDSKRIYFTTSHAVIIFLQVYNSFLDIGLNRLELTFDFFSWEMSSLRPFFNEIPIKFLCFY